METAAPILPERSYEDLVSYALLSKLSLCTDTSCLRPMEDRILVGKFPGTYICAVKYRCDDTNL